LPSLPDNWKELFLPDHALGSGMNGVDNEEWGLIILYPGEGSPLYSKEWGPHLLPQSAVLPGCLSIKNKQPRNIITLHMPTHINILPIKF
jgi:hypothetical protein